MKMSWEEEFQKAYNSFPKIVEEPVEYRIHYDDSGRIVMCSSRNHPENTQYLVVDQETYDNYFRYTVNVSKKRLEKIALDLGISVKLTKSTHGYAVVKTHAGLLLEKDEIYNDIEYYDSNN
jgi:hypothetical protein